jgi:hypothetical protein
MKHQSQSDVVLEIIISHSAFVKLCDQNVSKREEEKTIYLCINIILISFKMKNIVNSSYVCECSNWSYTKEIAATYRRILASQLETAYPTLKNSCEMHRTQETT